MKRVAFKMKLHPGKASIYRERHALLWPELKELLQSAGISDYAIFLDEETLTLFATLKISDQATLATLPAHPVMQKWWKHMSDIMDSNPDHSPMSKNLVEVFYLP